ncbi:MAG: UDP-N-acetylmuramoyl-tripeptide--D-alanyl-D-alanine ligase [Gammaproteobacteria bacterium]|nr:UDP-N-acetylmuramoyl-tripeptide--D-alanyl-D-alanine ligase [Gammaproteobacteria bacterium]
MTVLDLSFISLHVNGAELRGDNVALTGVTQDTRNLKPGELYVAISGARFDGHDFVSAAEEAGAAAVLVEREVETSLPQVIVPDSQKALGEFASAWRCEFQLPVIGITGSTGKTTVKQMLASIFSGIGNTLYTLGNYNNEIGVPLTLLRLRADHDFAVIEMGANHVGDIAYLVSLVRPGIGLVTNAGAAHLEGFGSLEGVVQGKGEIYEGVVDGGVCVINGDQPWADEWVERAGMRRIVKFGIAGAFDFHVSGMVEEEGGVQSFTLQTPSGAVDVRLALPGRHNVANALAASAAAWARGANLEQIRHGLENVEMVSGRMSVTQLPDGTTLVDDSYNANPLSMRAAIDWLAGTGRPGIFVMGDMGELGPDSEAMHADVGDYAAERGIRHFLAVGEETAAACRAFGEDAQNFSDIESLVEALDALAKPGMTIVVKGSRSSRMERVVAALKERRAG